MTDSTREKVLSLGEAYFEIAHSTDPYTATVLGVSGFDDATPDPRRGASEEALRRLAGVEAELASVPEPTDLATRVDKEVLSALVFGMSTEHRHRLWEANASAASYSAPQAMAFQSVPVAVVRTSEAVDAYEARLDALGGYFAGIVESFRLAQAEGRFSTRVGIAQAIEQLDGHLAQGAAGDAFINVPLPPELDTPSQRARFADIVSRSVWPEMRRLRAVLADEMAPNARPDDAVGIGHVEGGAAGYLDAVRKHTTTTMGPEEIHQVGLGVLEALEEEWKRIGQAALGESDVEEIYRRLRDDPALRFTSTHEIVEVVKSALERATAAVPRFFPDRTIADCVIEEISPIEAGNAALAYYRPPSEDGSRPGAHCVLTAQPELRYRYEYEALAFHESTPGHHLQIATSQAVPSIPRFRRYLDAEVCGFVEGWGLYSERLADEMGLYSSDLARLGMLSFDALRACRLVVDTGMHYYGWSRQKAMDFMWSHTATTEANVRNEIDRYIAWPGQALAYMIGRRHIASERRRAEAALGDRFDIRAFHDVALGNGAVPLAVLSTIVDDLIVRG